MPASSPSRIGFIGLGIMGAPMAGHLLAAGHRVATSEHHKPAPASLTERGLQALRTPKEVAAASDVVILMLPDTPQVEEVLFGADGVAHGLKRGTTVIDMSSIAPLATRSFADTIAGLGGHYLDAPVSGGEIGAKQATLTIMVGGDDVTFQRALPLFQRMGKNITHVGPVGCGQIAKIANQIVVALTIEAVGEALVFASKAGADPAKVREALMGGFASSRILEVHGKRMIERTFDSGFRIALHSKDLNLALEAARSLGVALPNTAGAQELFNSCIAHGGGGSDHSALVTALERMANHAVARPAVQVAAE